MVAGVFALGAVVGGVVAIVWGRHLRRPLLLGVGWLSLGAVVVGAILRAL